MRVGNAGEADMSTGHRTTATGRESVNLKECKTPSSSDLSVSLSRVRCP